MRGLARQRLPARHARQVHEPLAALLELIRHVVEGVDGPADLIARRGTGLPAGLEPSRPVATCEIGQARGELLDRPAHAVGDQDQRQQRNQPRGTQQHEQRQRESPPQIARIDLVHEAARLPQLGGQLLHADAAQVAAGDLDATRAAGPVRPPHVVDALAAGPRHAKALGLTALPERSDGLGPLGRVRRRVDRRRVRPASASCFSASRSRW